MQTGQRLSKPSVNLHETNTPVIFATINLLSEKQGVVKLYLKRSSLHDLASWIIKEFVFERHQIKIILNMIPLPNISFLSLYINLSKK